MGNPALGFLLVICLCAFISARTRRIVLQWLCLEINILSFIPLLVRGGVSSDIIVGVKYFLSQRIASLLFFRLVVLNISSIRIEIVIIRTILFKLGVPPFHSWLIRVLGELKPIFIFFFLRFKSWCLFLFFHNLKFL